MNISMVVKIAGFLVIPIILMLIVIYLLYPMLNKEKYDLIISTNGTMYDSLTVDSLAKIDSLMRVDSLIIADSIATKELEQYEQAQKINFATKMDSLERLIFVLSNRLEGLVVKEESAKKSQQTGDTEEDFKDRVKSLLNLEEKDMAPILDKMTNQQLVRLYREAGNTQREKILRALNSDRAARLITEVML